MTAPRENHTLAYSGKMSTTKTLPTRSVHPRKKIYVAQVFFVLMLFGGLLVPWTIWWWFHAAPNTVLATTDVGQFVASSKGSDGTNVQTTKATLQWTEYSRPCAEASF